MTDSRRSRWFVTGARAATGAVLSAGIVVAVVLAVNAPWPTVTREPVAISAVPTASDTVGACDGGMLVAGRSAGAAGEITVAAAQTPLVAAGGPYSQVQLTADDVNGLEGVPAFVAEPVDGAAVPLAAAAAARVSADDIAGFALDACRTPLFDSWLVGGSTRTGETDLVLLANPGDVAATVELTVYGVTGPETPPGGTGLAVPARSQIVIPLSGIARGQDSPVVRVTATGAPVRASLQSSIVRTLAPGGIDQQSAVALPERTQVIPGLVVTTRPTASATLESTTIARLLAPASDGEAEVTVRAVGRADPVLEPVTVPLTTGVPLQLELPGLQTGSYAVTVAASVPVGAAVWQTTGFGAGADIAWLTSAPELTRPTLIAVPGGPLPRLHLVNLGESDVELQLRIVEGAGSDATVSVPGGGGVAVPIARDTVWEIDAGGAPGIHGQVTMSGTRALAGYAVWPSDAAADPVTVYP